MGITGLLPFLKAIQREIHLSSFKGKKAAVDSYCWLHKGAYSCAMQLVMGTANLETLPFIRYCMKRVNLLRQYDITPIMVFDGGYLPTKANTEKERRERRQGYLAKGKQLLKDGKKSEASDCFQKCVDVSPEMALALIKACRKIGVECVVAPYEADAQLAYLQKENIVDFVITEDSDLLVFGSQKVFFKMDDSGNGKLIDLNDLGKANKGLVGFTQDSFRQMCIFSGCDYLASVPGIGLGKALKLMRRCNQNPTQVIKTLHYETGKVPKNYEEDFRRAEYTFLYQLVFDPRSQKQVRLNQLPDDVDSNEFEFAGVEHSPKKAVHMARGNIDPITLRVLDSYSPSKAPPLKSTSWAASAMAGSNKNYPLAIQAKLPLVSTEKSKQPFRVPKRKLVPLKDEDEGSLGEQELCSMYMSSSDPYSKESQSERANYGSNKTFSASLSSLAGTKLKNKNTEMNQSVIRSRYFASSSPDTQSSVVEYSEETPSENPELQSSHSVRRVIRTTEPEQRDHTSDGMEEFSDYYSEVPTRLGTPADSKVYSEDDSLRSVKKQLFGYAYRNEGLKDKYDYSSPKRLRMDIETAQLVKSTRSKHPFELLEESSPIVTNKPRTLKSSESTLNPFSVSRQSPKTLAGGSLRISEDVKSLETNSTRSDVTEIGIENSIPISHVDSTPFVSTDEPEAESLKHQRDSKEDAQTTSHFMTSNNFINPFPSVQLDSNTIDRGSQRKHTEPVLISRSKSVDVGCSSSTSSQGGWLSTRRASLAPPKGSKTRARAVGLAKSNSRSKFKPPRSVDSDSNQTTLRGFIYTKKPQMKH